MAPWQSARGMGGLAIIRGGRLLWPVAAALLCAAAIGLAASMSQAADAPLGGPRPAGTASTQPAKTSPAPAVAVGAAAAPATAPAAEPNQPAGSGQAPRT